ncbi:MAG TPA: ABC transporter ATP-binding protein [Acidobacteriota bacterium]|nr:ABC transporter ATP-binding protein [Acidobacteriota bacterium]
MLRGQAGTPLHAMIQARRLNKLYGRQKAIEDLTFSVEAGEIVGLLGPNGAGKTTTMRILAGYFPPTSGTVRVAGFDLLRQPRQAKSRIGYLPERPPLYPHLRVDAYLRLVDTLKGAAEEPFSRRLQQVKDECGLSDCGSQLIAHLSKGFRRRLGLAQALIHDPQVLILDEPTEGLDPQQISEVRTLIQGLAGRRSVLLSTHILPEVSVTCGRVLIIHRGRLIAEGSPRDLRSRLGRGALIEMQVEGPVESLPARLRAMAGVSNAVLEESPGRGRLLLVEAEAGADIRAQSARLVVESGCGLLSMHSRDASLEDIFLHLTTEEERAAPDSPPSSREDPDREEVAG